jgi:hypothetical protein
LETLTLTLSPSLTQNYAVETKSIELGENGVAVTVPVGRVIKENWNVTSTRLKNAVCDAADDLLKFIQGQDFLFRPIPTVGLWTWKAKSWVTSAINHEYKSLNLSIERTQTQLIDECIASTGAVAMVGIPAFPINAFSWESRQAANFKRYEQRLDGGVDDIATYAYNAKKHAWTVDRLIDGAMKETIHKFLKDQCGRPFNFQATPDGAIQLHNCFNWQFQHVDTGLDYWVFSATFTQNVSPYKASPYNVLLSQFDFYGDKPSIVTAVSAEFPNILGWIADSKTFIDTYTRNTLPLYINNDGLLINSFHTVLGRGGYFPGSAGTTEGQAVVVRAAMAAFNATGVTAWKNLATTAADALLTKYYPIQIPSGWTAANGIRVPHWLINIKSSFVSKGKVENNPLNYGHFDLLVNFVNGVGTIPTGSPNFGDLLANVYIVYPSTDKLLWQNVYTYPLGGFRYEVDYWVTNVMLEGIVSRQYGDSESNGGRLPTPTTEAAGKIVLKTAFTGTAKVVYSSYSGPTIAVGDLFEPYPMWRKLRAGEALAAFDVFPWSEDAFDELWKATNTVKYREARDCTIYSESIVAQVNNPSRWFQKDDATNPFSFPGSQVILANHAPGAIATATRVVGGIKDQWIDIDIPASTMLYPSAEYQNFAVQIKAAENMTVTVAIECSQATDITINLSLARSAFDYSLYYAAHILIAANTPTTRTFGMEDFLWWDLQRTSWHPHVAENPTYVYSGGGGTTSVTKELEPIGALNRIIYRFQLNKGGGYAGAGLVALGKPLVFPVEILYRSTGGEASLKATVDGVDYLYVLPTTGWTTVKIQSSQFVGSPRPSAIISNLEIVATGTTATDVGLFFVGFRPLTMQLPVQTYKASIVTRITTAHRLSIGEFSASGSPSENLTYSPGAVPFTVNVVSTGNPASPLAVDAWRGAPYVAYISLGWYVKQGLWSRLRKGLDFLLESQVQYARQNVNQTNGPFAPVFYWGAWDSGDLSPNGVDIWSFVGSDPSTDWVGYAVRPVESTAHGWYRLVTGDYASTPPSDKDELIAKSQKITMQFLWWVSSFYTKRNSIQPPTNFKPKVDPEVNYHEPHAAAFMLRTAIYANLAGGDAATTIRVIKASIDYLKSQRITTGAMLGSFAAGQPAFTTGGTNYREYYGFWHVEIIEALALLHTKKALLNYPDCMYLIRA